MRRVTLKTNQMYPCQAVVASLFIFLFGCAESNLVNSIQDAFGQSFQEHPVVKVVILQGSACTSSSNFL